MPMTTRTERLDGLPFTRKHRKLLLGSGVGWALDAMDVGLISFVMAALAAQWKLDNNTLSWIGSIGFVGMALGASLGGLLADRIGRRNVFAVTLLIYGLATGASALVGSVAALMALRFLVGLGLGAELPVASTLISEFAPKAIRGRMVVALEAFWALGWILAALIGYFVIPMSDNGWRWALAVGIVLMVQMQTWRRGRALVAMRIRRGERPLQEVLDESNPQRVPGTAVFMFKDLGKAPPALVNNLKHNKVLHRTTLIVSVDTAEWPRVPEAERATVTKVEPGVFQVQLEFGFMDEPDVPAALAAIEYRGLHFDIDDVTYFIGHESIVAGKAPGMNPLAEHLFVLLNRGADSASRFFNLPYDRVFEVGSRVEI